MANIVEFLVKIRDVASGQMRNLANASDGAFNRMSSRMNRVGNSVDQLNTRIDALTKTRDISVDLRQIRRANDEIDKLERKRDSLTNKSGGGLGFFGKSLLIGGASAIAGLGVHSLKAGMERQMAGTSFDVMAGKGQGDKLHKNLMGFATDTIYGNEVFGEAKTMLGFGVAAKNIMPALKMLGDVAMGDAEHMKSLSLAFAQSASAGKLTGQDLLQYVNAGFNPLQAMSEKTGRKMADLRKDMEKGKITFQDLAGAFDYATGPMGRFHNGMKKMGETPTGKWMAFTGAMETLAGTVGMALLPSLGGLVDMMNWMGTQQPLMYGIASAIGAMTIAWGVYTVYTKWATIWSTMLSIAAFWPVLAIGILVGAVVWAAKSFDGWGKSVTGLWGVIKGFFSIVGIVVKNHFQEWLYTFDLFYLKAKSVFQYVGTLISNTVEAMKLALSGNFVGAKNILTAHITTDADKEIDQLKKHRMGQLAQNGKDVASNVNAIKKSWGDVGLKRHKDAGDKKSSSDWMTSKFDMKNGAAGGAPAGVADSAKGISGGGVRHLTINIAKQGIDEITIHVANLTEGKEKIKTMFIEMFNQVVNSGNATVSSN